MTAIIQVVLQAGAFGLLTYIVIYAFPKYESDNRQERDDQRRQFTVALSEQNAAHERHLGIIKEAIDEQTDKLTDALGSDPQKLCQAAEILKHANICKAEEAARFAKMILEKKQGARKPD